MGHSQTNSYLQENIDTMLKWLVEKRFVRRTNVGTLEENWDDETPSWVDFTMGINMTRNPAGVIPVGVSSSSNIPIAIQIIGGQRQDLDVLNAMQAFEKVINFSDKATDHE